MSNRKIGFIGTGNMGSAMIGGLVSSGNRTASDIHVSDRNEMSLEKISKEWPDIHTSQDNLETVRKADIIVIAVKPHIYKAVISEIRSEINSTKVIVTIAAGIDMKAVEEMFSSDVKVIRTMPNTPALVGAGVTAYCCNSLVTADDEKEVVSLLGSFGIVEKIEEKYFHSVIAVSGSSPAYVFMFIEAMADGAVLKGLPRDQAYRMASQAVFGAAKMVLETGNHPGALKDAVCSPGGTTIEAVAELEAKGLRNAVISAMSRCEEKSKEMTNK